MTFRDRFAAKLGVSNSNTAIDRAGQQALDKAAEYLTQYARLQMEIVGEADQQATNISEQRLAAVRDYLNSHWKITAERVTLPQGDTNSTITDPATVILRLHINGG